MVKIYKWSMFWVVLYMYSVIMIKADANPETFCSTHAKPLDITVVTFCEYRHVSDSTERIMLDGVSVNITPDTSCSCVIKSMRKQNLPFSALTSTQMQADCSSYIRVDFKESNVTINCNNGASGVMGLDEDEEKYIILKKTNTQYHTGNCLLLGNLNVNYSFNVTCFAANHILSTLPEEMMLESTPIFSKQSTVSSALLELTTTLSKKSTVSSSTETRAVSTQDIITNVNVTYSEVTTKDALISNISDEDDNNLYMYIGVGSGGAVLLVILILIVIGCKRRRQHKTPSESQQSHRCNYNDDDDDDGELKYNVLYTSSGKHSRTMDENRISYDIEGNYTTVDDDSKTKQENTVDKSEKLNVSPKGSNLSDNGSDIPLDNSSVKHISTVDGGCEYAVLHKSKNSADKETPKTIITADNINAEVDKTEDPPETQDVVDNTYAVVDKTNKRQNTDTSKNEMKDSAAEEGMSTSQKTTGLTGVVTRPTSLENADIQSDNQEKTSSDKTFQVSMFGDCGGYTDIGIEN